MAEDFSSPLKVRVKAHRGTEVADNHSCICRLESALNLRILKVGGRTYCSVPVKVGLLTRTTEENGDLAAEEWKWGEHRSFILLCERKNTKGVCQKM